MRRSLILAAVALLGAACSSSDAADNRTRNSLETSPSASPDAGTSSPLGPMAVIESAGTGTTDALGGSGPVTITDQCVNLRNENGNDLLLVWRSAEVRWDDYEQEIVFTSKAVPGRSAVIIEGDDEITIGGEFFEMEGGGERDVEWVAEPHESCAGELFIVDYVKESS